MGVVVSRLKVAVDLEGSNGPGLALGPQKSMIFGLIVATCSAAVFNRSRFN
jgi:hypothetical protein